MSKLLSLSGSGSDGTRDETIGIWDSSGSDSKVRLFLLLACRGRGEFGGCMITAASYLSVALASCRHIDCSSGVRSSSDESVDCANAALGGV